MPEAPAGPPRDHPVWVLMTSHWLSLLGMGLVGSALISWLFVLPLHVRGHADNPYIGILVFMVIPIVLFIGLGMVPLGVFLARKRARQRLDGGDRGPKGRHPANGLVPRHRHAHQRRRRDPRHLPGCRAHGVGAVLRPDLPCHDARVPRPCGFAARARAVRRVPRRRGGARLGREQDLGHAATGRGDLQLLPPADPLGPRNRQAGALARDLREVSLAGEVRLGAAQGDSQVRRGRSQHGQPDRSHDDGRGQPDARHPRLTLRPGRRDPLCRRRQEAAEDPVGGIPQHQEGGDALLPCGGRDRGSGERSPALHDAVRGLPQSTHPRLRAAGPGRGQGDDGRPAARHASVPQEEERGAAEGRLPEQRRGGAAHPRGTHGLLPAGLSEGRLRTKGRRGGGREDARPHLQHERIPGPESRLGALSEQPGPRGVSRLLPLPRRRAQGRRRKDHHPGLRRMPRSGGHGGELSGSARRPWGSRRGSWPSGSRSARTSETSTSTPYERSKEPSSYRDAARRFSPRS